MSGRLLPNRSPAAWGSQESPLGAQIFAAAPKTLPVELLTFWLSQWAKRNAYNYLFLPPMYFLGFNMIGV